MTSNADHSRLSLLCAALGFLRLPPEAPELRLLRAWTDTWAGVGAIVAGLHRTGYDLDLRQYGDGHWRASFYVTGFADSILGGSAWEPTVWRAVQLAGWDALRHAEHNLISPVAALAIRAIESAGERGWPWPPANPRCLT